jgi:superfamily II DNA/RNA helicase
MGDGICGQNAPAQDQADACSNQLQNRHCQPDLLDRDRSRWHIACCAQSPGTGPQERTGARWIRLDSVEVYEPGRDGTFAGVCPDGQVYNFEVEGDHTYLANGFVVHNCHHSAASGYQAVLDALPDAFVLGVTATPDRMDKQSIEHIFGEPLFSASIIDMVEQDYLSNLRAIAIPTATSLDGLHTQERDFKLAELEVAIDTPDRNARIARAYLKYCDGRQALCFAVTVAHAEHLAETFQTMGVQAAVVSGETSPETRKQLLHDYERGTLQVLCNCGVLTEGYDAPQTSCILMARPTKSRALYMQCIGRGTRKAPGKQDCIILDITDNCLKHRLEPLSLSAVLGKHLQDGESILEAKAREEQERARQSKQAEEAKERTTSVTRRESDVEVNVLARMDWRRNPNGVYVLEVGEHRHRILLFPSDTTAGFYSVWAKLAPDFRGQQWCHEVPLEWALQHAEIKARLLQSEKKTLVDNNAPWRSFPVSNKQLFMLRKFGIPFTEDMTSGEASDLIGKAIAEREEQKTRSKAEKAAKRSIRQGSKDRKASA